MKKIHKHKQEQVLYTFRYDQIVAGDVREFLEKFDPFRLSNSRVRELYGNLVLGFEGVENSAVFTHPEVRVILRRLHAIWPWSGFFLDLENPVGPSKSINNYPLLGLGLSLSDMWICQWAKTNEARIKVGPQLQQYRNTCLDVVNRLGKKTGLSAEVIQARHLAIDKQFQHGILA